MKSKYVAMVERVRILNNIYKRPVSEFASSVGEPIKFNVGHLRIDYNGQGYQLEECTSEGGATKNISGRLSINSMDHYISGMFDGAAFMAGSIQKP